MLELFNKKEGSDLQGGGALGFQEGPLFVDWVGFLDWVGFSPAVQYTWGLWYTFYADRFLTCAHN